MVVEQSQDEHGATGGLAAVAAAAGVSISTVSKVVNGRADVGPQTRARVQTLLETHDYIARRPPAAGADPPAAVTLELVLHSTLTAYTMAILDGVVDAAAETGVTVAVSARRRQRRAAGQPRSSQWVHQLNTLGRAAVIDVVDDTEHGDLSALSRSKIPLVVIDPMSLPRRDVPSVSSTNFSGGLIATEHLLGLGHRRIAHLGASTHRLFSQARLHGYRAALEKASVEPTDRYVIYGDHDYDSGVVGGGQLLDLAEPPTAIFAATDECAAGVIEAARLRGRRVPQDLSIVGFDDAPISRILSPPLTTVRQPLREMGRVALSMAVALTRGDRLDSHHVELATELVVRHSTTGLPPALADRS